MLTKASSSWSFGDPDYRLMPRRSLLCLFGDLFVGVGRVYGDTRHDDLHPRWNSSKCPKGVIPHGHDVEAFPRTTHPGSFRSRGRSSQWPLPQQGSHRLNSPPSSIAEACTGIPDDLLFWLPNTAPIGVAVGSYSVGHIGGASGGLIVGTGCLPLARRSPYTSRVCRCLASAGRWNALLVSK